MWGNLTLFHRAKYIENNIRKRQILAQLIEESFLIHKLTTNNAMYCEWLTLINLTSSGNFYG